MNGFCGALRYKFFLAILGTSPLWFGVLLFVYVPRNSVGELYSNTRRMGEMNQGAFWNTKNMKELQIPPDITTNAKNVQVQEAKISVEGASVFYRESNPNKGAHISILLLHGMRFSSKTWLDLGTIHLLAAMGYRVVAVDLPGYGDSPSANIKDRGEFLHSLIEGLKLNHPVIVSPSMSGSFALPYLLKHWEAMGGYVPVAPIGWEVLEKYKECKEQNPSSFTNVPEPLKQYLKPPVPDLNCIKVPTLVVYGENDRSRSSALLCLLPFSQAAEIPNGAHPAYLTDPDLWHQLLYNFLHLADTNIKQKSN